MLTSGGCRPAASVQGSGSISMLCLNTGKPFRGYLEVHDNEQHLLAQHFKSFSNVKR